METTTTQTTETLPSREMLNDEAFFRVQGVMVNYIHKGSEWFCSLAEIMHRHGMFIYSEACADLNQIASAEFSHKSQSGFYLFEKVERTLRLPSEYRLDYCYDKNS